MKIRTIVLWLVAGLILFFVNWQIWQKEQLALTGQVVLLELAPVDPRSLIQGDYMRLRYAVADEVPDTADDKRGHIVVKLDENNIAQFVRLDDGQTPLAANEVRLPYRQRTFDVQIGPESFFFEEGQAEVYEAAEYGEFRVSPEGEMVLVGLRDENLGVLGARD